MDSSRGRTAISHLDHHSIQTIFSPPNQLVLFLFHLTSLPHSEPSTSSYHPNPPNTATSTLKLTGPSRDHGWPSTRICGHLAKRSRDLSWRKASHGGLSSSNYPCFRLWCFNGRYFQKAPVVGRSSLGSL